MSYFSQPDPSWNQPPGSNPLPASGSPESPVLSPEALRTELEMARQHLRQLQQIAKSGPTNAHSLGKVIRRLREARQMTVRDFSKITGVGCGMLYGLETLASPNPTYNNLCRIAAGLGLPLSELIALAEKSPV